MLKHLECYLVGLVMGRTRQNADFRWERSRGVRLGDNGGLGGGCGGLGGVQIVDQLARGLVNEVRLLDRQVATPLILCSVIERGSNTASYTSGSGWVCRSSSTTSTAPSWSRATSRW